ASGALIRSRSSSPRGELLRDLISAPDAPGLLLVLVSRERPGDSAAPPEPPEPLGPGGDIRTIVLGGLSAQDCTALAIHTAAQIRSATPALDDELAARIAAGADGNPHFILELTRATVAQQGVPPSTVSELLDQRVRALDSPARRVLALLHAAAGPLPRGLLDQAGDLGPGEFADLLPLLAQDGLIAINGYSRTDTVELLHPRVAEVVAHAGTDSGAPDSAATAELHRTLAQAWADWPEHDAKQLFHHWRAAGHEERARQCALAAAEQAHTAERYDGAAELYGLACSSGPLDPALLQRWADSLSAAGRLAEAGEVLLRSPDDSDAADSDSAEVSEERAWQLARAAELLLHSGRIARGLLTLNRIAAQLELSAPTGFGSVSTWQRAIARLRRRGFRPRPADQLEPRALRRVDILAGVTFGMLGVDQRRCADLQDEHLRQALAAGELARVQRALAVEYAMGAAVGTPATRRQQRLGDELDDLTARLDSPRGHGLADLARGMARLECGEFESAQALLSRAHGNLSESRSYTDYRDKQTVLTALYQVHSQLAQGKLAGARAVVDGLVAAAQARGDHYTLAALSLGPNVQIWLAADQPDQAAERVDRAAAVIEGEVSPILLYLELLARSAIALYRGRPRVALELLAQREQEMTRAELIGVRSMRIQLSDTRARCHLARAAREPRQRTEDLERAVAHANKLQREALLWPSALAAAIHAGAAEIAGDASDGQWKRAAALFESAGMRLHSGACLWRAAPPDQRQTATTALMVRGVAEPEPFIDMLVPGAVRPES
ncbi:MAG: hypothetical protein AAGC55_07020, partial [Myxococcota bacterium]